MQLLILADNCSDRSQDIFPIKTEHILSLKAHHMKREALKHNTQKTKILTEES